MAINGTLQLEQNYFQNGLGTLTFTVPATVSALLTPVVNIPFSVNVQASVPAYDATGAGGGSGADQGFGVTGGYAGASQALLTSGHGITGLGTAFPNMPANSALGVDPTTGAEAAPNLPSVALGSGALGLGFDNASASNDGASGNGNGHGAGSGGGTLDGFAVGGQVPSSGSAAVAAVAATLVNQGVTYTAQTAGTAGNDIAIEIINPGADGALSISTVGKSIIITLAYATGAPTTTATQLVAAINADSGAHALVQASGSGASPLAALSTTQLSGGANAVSAVAASGYGSKGQGFGTDLSGYNQPPANVIVPTSVAAVSSGVSIVVKLNGSTKYTAPVLGGSQTSVQFKTSFLCSAADSITVVFASSSASDQQLQGVSANVSVVQGG